MKRNIESGNGTKESDVFTAGCCILCLSVRSKVVEKLLFFLDGVAIGTYKSEKIRTLVSTLDSSESSPSVEGES